MPGAEALTPAEVRLIKAMLRLSPKPSYQAILSHFSRPGRDINHRVIGEFDSGMHWPQEPPALESEAKAFMVAAAIQMPIRAEDFVSMTATGAASEQWIGSLGLSWWPVGQGLFASGTIVPFNGVPRTWVFDCGTDSSDDLIDVALTGFERQQKAHGVSSIRLAVLSHFDNDHVSGFVRLLDRFPVRTLLLPYIPRWQRLLIALSEGVTADDDRLAFYLDPTAYLMEASKGQIEEVVYVTAAGREDEPGLSEDPEAGFDPDEGPAFLEDVLKVEEGRPPEEAIDDPAATSSSATVRFLAPGGRLVMPLLWEFVPYNDATYAPRMTSAMITTAKALVAELLTKPKADRDDLLGKLKALYDSKFTTSRMRNMISLFLYSGATSRRLNFVGPWYGRRSHLVESDRFSQMYTGDGYLHDDARCDAFESFFSPNDRLERSAFVQVMHHGAKGNWRAGTAALLNPAVSIFSSDPRRKKPGHPHADVLRDFWTFGPVQVDGAQGFHIGGLLKRL